MSTMHNGYVHIYAPSHARAHSNGCVPEHILIAERVLGHPLPPQAVVHHVNEITHENQTNNLVICENDVYHKLLHRRMRALRMAGSVQALQCFFCKQWDLPGINGMLVYQRRTVNGSTNSYHPACRSGHRRSRYAQSPDQNRQVNARRRDQYRANVGRNTK